jgi:hypothetical protein
MERAIHQGIRGAYSGSIMALASARLVGEKRFTLKPEHLALLRRAYVGWDDCEFGAPAIDCKRPYGNSSVYSDICEILEIPYDEDEGIDDATKDRLRELHEETRIALQIMIAHPAIEPGEYVASGYGADWRRA